MGKNAFEKPVQPILVEELYQDIIEIFKKIISHHLANPTA
jgi:hypothetical protein